jgi:hypothetical protein
LTHGRRASATLSLLGLALALTACSSGPDDIADGNYRAFAVSADVRDVPPVTLTIEGDTLTVAEGDVLTSASLGEGHDAFVLCPPDGTGVPIPLGDALSLGTTNFDAPAVFGDCGDVSPSRVTIVDLDSHDQDGGPMPFTRWIEFCDTADTDCR